MAGPSDLTPGGGEDELLDLPLDTGDPEALALDHGVPGAGQRARERRFDLHRPPPRRRAPSFLGIGLVLAGLAVGGYFLLRPAPPRFEVAAPRVEFGPLRVGEAGEPVEVRFRNAGEQPLPVDAVGVEGAQAADFEKVDDRCSGVALAPGEGCVVRLRFRPEQSGARGAMLRATGKASNAPFELPLAGSATAPRLTIEPTRVDFGTQAVGTVGDAAVLTFSNVGSAPLTIKKVGLSGSAAGDFERLFDNCSDAVVDPGGACALHLAFAPRAAGSRTAAVAVESDAEAPPPPVALAGDGVWTGPPMAVDPERLVFGKVVVGGEPGSRTAVLLNRGEAPLAIGVVAVDVPRLGFSVTEEDCSDRNLAAGESCTVRVEYRPPEEGESEALLQIEQPGSEGRFGLPLSGVGVVPRVALSPERLSFGETRLSGRPTRRTLRLASRGSAPAGVVAVEIAGADAAAFRLVAAPCTGGAVPPGESCEIAVAFAPRREGAHEAALTVRLESPLSPRNVPLVGLGAEPRVALSSESLEFGRVRITTHEDRVLELTSSGLADLLVRKVAIGDGESDFQVVENTCQGGGPLASRARCTVTVRFAPEELGPREAVLEVATNAVGGAREVRLVGSGLPRPVPELRAAPATLDFGERPVESRSSIATVTVHNPGTGGLVLREVAVEGPEAADFRVVPGTCQGPPSIAPGGDCTIGVRFTPKAAGPRRARLVLRHNGPEGVHSIELRGEGLGAGGG